MYNNGQGRPAGKLRSKVEIRLDGTKHSASGIPSNLSSMDRTTTLARTKATLNTIPSNHCTLVHFVPLTFHDYRGLSSVFIIRPTRL